MRVSMIGVFAAGAVTLTAAVLAEKPVLVAFRNHFEGAVEEAQKRNLPLLFIYGKDN